MAHTRHSDVFCPVLATLDLLNQRWNLHIILSLLEGTKRFNELGRENGINPRTLRERLVALEIEGVIQRRVVSHAPPNVEYSLTEKGRALGQVFESLGDWGRTWMKPPPGCYDKRGG